MKNLAMMILMVLATSVSQAAKNLELSCSVVSVGEANNYVLEEGLGSIYDISEEGYVGSDADSTSAVVSIKGKKIELNLGQGSWNSDSVKMKMKTFKYESDSLSEEQEGLEIQVRDDLGLHVWRIFPRIKIVQINFTGNEYQNTHLATLDCSGVLDTRLR